jgi:hypothetical protein
MLFVLSSIVVASVAQETVLLDAPEATNGFTCCEPALTCDYPEASTDCVCKFDPFCCTVMWDKTCIDASLSECGVVCESDKDDPLDVDGGVFKFTVDLFASATGYYKVEGYEGHSPTLTMEKGKTYAFIQEKIDNWYHPLGFAYYPDGALADHAVVCPDADIDPADGCPEIEGDNLQYFINNRLSDLDTYEPAFTLPLGDWHSEVFYVKLDVDEDVKEIFYFCHIHQGMSGRILIEGVSPEVASEPSIALATIEPKDEFDQQCGTYGSKPFSGDTCPPQFCVPPEDETFAECMQAIDCQMAKEMHVSCEGTNKGINPAMATFNIQMIPHHDNAVNMATILLKMALEQNWGAEQGWDEEFETMMREIINTQNAQITYMNQWLRDNGYPPAESTICDAEPQRRSGLP